MVVLFAALGLLVGALVNWAADGLPRAGAQGANPAPERGPAPALAIAAMLLRLWRRAKPHDAHPLWPRAAVELLNALWFAYAWASLGASWRALALALVGAFLLLISVADLRYQIVPNLLILPATVVVLLAQVFPVGAHTLSALLGGAVALALWGLLALIKPGGMGGGDIKLALFIGLLCGFPLVLWALMLGTLAGALATLILLAMHRAQFNRTIPYAPFLCLGALVALALNPSASVLAFL